MLQRASLSSGAKQTKQQYAPFRRIADPAKSLSQSTDEPDPTSESSTANSGSGEETASPVSQEDESDEKQSKRNKKKTKENGRSLKSSVKEALEDL